LRGRMVEGRATPRSRGGRETGEGGKGRLGGTGATEPGGTGGRRGPGGPGAPAEAGPEAVLPSAVLHNVKALFITANSSHLSGCGGKNHGKERADFFVFFSRVPQRVVPWTTTIVT